MIGSIRYNATDRAICTHNTHPIKPQTHKNTTGRLDGGRAFASAFGPRRAGRVGVLVLLGQALLCVLSRAGMPLLFLYVC